MLKIDVSGDTLVILVDQLRLDMQVGAQVKQELAGLLVMPVAHVVLDLKQVNYVDTYGLSALVFALNTARRQWKTLHLRHVGTALRALLDSTRLNDLFPIQADAPPSFTLAVA